MREIRMLHLTWREVELSEVIVVVQHRMMEAEMADM